MESMSIKISLNKICDIVFYTESDSNALQYIREKNMVSCGSNVPMMLYGRFRWLRVRVLCRIFLLTPLALVKYGCNIKGLISENMLWNNFMSPSYEIALTEITWDTLVISQY